MNKMNELFSWLRDGINRGLLSAEDAFEIVSSRASSPVIASDDVSPCVTSPSVEVTEDKKVRLKKDGTPWGKRGSKMKQADLPTVNVNE